jgi:hypothetical protein
MRSARRAPTADMFMEALKNVASGSSLAREAQPDMGYGEHRRAKFESRVRFCRTSFVSTSYNIWQIHRIILIKDAPR